MVERMEGAFLKYIAKQGETPLGEEGLALLEVNPGLMIWTFITFAIVLFLLQRFAWRPIAKALEQRASKIRNDLDQAQQLKDEAEEKLSEYLRKLEQLNAEGEALLKQRRAEAEQAKEQLLASARQEAEALMERAKREIEKSRNEAIQEIHRQVVDLSVAVAGQILERSLSSKDHEKLAFDTARALQMARNAQGAN